jgi:UDP-glucose 4-epimerase
VTARRVLITGISGELPGALAKLLEARDEIEYIVGVDVREPRHDLRRTEFVRADIRNPLVARVITAANVDTVVHLSVAPAPGRAGRALMKERNVIGTMQLVAACQKAPSVERLVVKSSTAVYGSDYTDPVLFTEEMTPRLTPTGGFAKDVTEVEDYVRSFGRRRRDVSVTILRFANFIGGNVASVFARYFSLPVVPTVFGFDPRLQFCHPDDAIAVLEKSVVEDHSGIYNVSGLGVLYLSQAIRLAGRIGAPVPEPFINLSGALVRRSQKIDFSPEQLRFLLYGRVADVTRMRETLAYEPQYTTREAFDDFVARRRIRRVADTQETEWDRELYDFIQRKGQERFAAARQAATGADQPEDGE